MNVGNTINHDCMPAPLLTQDSAGIKQMQNNVKSMDAQAVLKAYNTGISS